MYKDLPCSFRDAIKSASKYYFTNKPCRKGHLSKRLTVNSNCYDCLIEYQSAKRALVKEIFNATDKTKSDLKNTPDVTSGVATDIKQEQPKNCGDWIVCPGKPHKKIKITKEIREVFEHWCFIMEKTNRTALDYDRASAIKQGLDMTDKNHLKLAIDGCKLDSWHMGENDRKTIYNEPSHIFKSMAKIERFIELTKPKPFELKLNANGKINTEDLRTAIEQGFFPLE